MAAMLPELVGTERQVEWATAIRCNVLTGALDEASLVAKWRRRLSREGTSDDDRQKDGASLAAWERLISTTSAEWWIDMRRQSLEQVARREGVRAAVRARQQRAG